MSNIVAAICQKRIFGSGPKKAVIMYMADRASDEGEGVWTSKRTIADDTELAKRTVQNAIQHFLDTGLISQIGRRSCQNGFTYEYQINLKAVEQLPLTSDHERKSTGATGAPLPDWGAGDSPDTCTTCTRQVQDMHPTHAPHAPKPSMNHPLTIHEPSNAQARDDREPVIFDDGPPPQTVWKGGLREGCATIEDEFEKVWPHYRAIRNCPKKPAIKAWRAARRKACFAEIAAPLAAYIKGRTGKDQQFTKHLSSWLNAESWTEEPEALLSGKETAQDRKARLLGGQTTTAQKRRDVPLLLNGGA